MDNHLITALGTLAALHCHGHHHEPPPLPPPPSQINFALFFTFEGKTYPQSALITDPGLRERYFAWLDAHPQSPVPIVIPPPCHKGHHEKHDDKSTTNRDDTPFNFSKMVIQDKPEHHEKVKLNEQFNVPEKTIQIMESDLPAFDVSDDE